MSAWRRRGVRQRVLLWVSLVGLCSVNFIILTGNASISFSKVQPSERVRSPASMMPLTCSSSQQWSLWEVPAPELGDHAQVAQLMASKNALGFDG